MEVNRSLPFLEELHLISRRSTARDLWFVLFLILSLVPFGASLSTLVSLSFQDDRYSHVILIPLMTAFLVYIQRKNIFTGARYCLSKAAPLLVVGIALFRLAQSRFSPVDPNDHLSVVVLAIVLVWVAGFLLCYGARCFRAALFPLLFLLLMIPLPTLVLDNAVLALQKGSAVMTYALLKLLGVPVLWQRFTFSLPGVDIEIAKECSGIRSSLALFITSILAGQVFLESSCRKLFFSLFTVPIVVFKNAVRIVTISCLGIYVDPGFLHGRLHRYGGLPFSLVSLAIFVPLLLALQKGDAHANDRSRANTAALEHPASVLEGPARIQAGG
jgi:exosortase